MLDVEELYGFKKDEEIIICPQHTQVSNRSYFSRGTKAKVLEFKDYLSVQIVIDNSQGEVMLVPIWMIKKLNICDDCPNRLARVIGQSCSASWKDLKEKEELDD